MFLSTICFENEFLESSGMRNNEMVQIYVEKNIYISFLIIESLSSNHAIKMYRKKNFCSKELIIFFYSREFFPLPLDMILKSYPANCKFSIPQIAV